MGRRCCVSHCKPNARKQQGPVWIVKTSAPLFFICKSRPQRTRASNILPLSSQSHSCLGGQDMFGVNFLTENIPLNFDWWIRELIKHSIIKATQLTIWPKSMMNVRVTAEWSLFPNDFIYFLVLITIKCFWSIQCLYQQSMKLQNAVSKWLLYSRKEKKTESLLCEKINPLWSEVNQHLTSSTKKPIPRVVDPQNNS